MNRQVVLDTETTGLDLRQGHRVIEIGCLEIIDRQITHRYLHTYLNPQRPSDEEALKIHGLTTEFLQDKPLFQEIADPFLAFIEGAELIIHNAPFDLSFLQFELQACNIKKLITECCTVLDTLLLARKLHPGQRNNLDALAKRYEVRSTKRGRHDALGDARLLAQIYLAMTAIGQTTLFETESRELVNSNSITHAENLPIHRADHEELLAHQATLTSIKKNSGHCLWLELEE